jgi:uncharacterized membrane protein
MSQFCHQCGHTIVEGTRFCTRCGTPLVPTQPQTEPSYQTPPAYPPGAQQQTPGYGQYPYQPPYHPQAANDLKPNIAGMLCYPLSFVSGIIFLALSPYNRDRFVKFHAYQSVFFFGALFAASLVLGILLPWRLERAMMGMLRLAFFGVTAFSMYKAYLGERFKLPVIGEYAERQADK